MLIRVRSQIGVWRLGDVKESDTIATLLGRLELEYQIVLNGRPLTKDCVGGSAVLSPESSIKSLGLQNGSMLYLEVDRSGTSFATTSKPSPIQKTGGKTIKNGVIVAQAYEESSLSSGFRPGMMALGSMKRQWKLQELIALDEQFTFNFTKLDKKIKEGNHLEVIMDENSIISFNNFMFGVDFRQMRVGFLYGKFLPDAKVKVEYIYEPPQDNTDTEFNLLEDPKEETVPFLATCLGLEKVGWIYAHAPREEGFRMSGTEAITAAELQLDAAGGPDGDSNFVTIKVTMDESRVAQVDAYQTHKLAMSMVAEGALEPSINPAFCKVNPTYTAIVEGRPTTEIDSDLLLTVAAIKQEKSEKFLHRFPITNRQAQTKEDLKRILDMEGKQGFTLKHLLADFHLLLFLSNFLDVKDDIAPLCEAILDDDKPIQDGTSLLIKSMAGFEM